MPMINADNEVNALHFLVDIPLISVIYVDKARGCAVLSTSTNPGILVF